MKNIKVVAIIQARMGSSRLRGKTLMDVSGKPLLQRLINQVKASEKINEIMLVTTTNEEDNPIEQFANNYNLRIVRDSQENVLKRYVIASRVSNADVIIRLTGDCALHSPDTIDEVISFYFSTNSDYVNNTSPYTRPDGQDVEVFSEQVLQRAYKYAHKAPDLEHVTLFIKRDKSIKKSYYLHSESCGHLKWSVDYLDDLNFVRKVWQRLDMKKKDNYKFHEILEAVGDCGAKPGKSTINEGYYLSILDNADVKPASPLILKKSLELLNRSSKVIPGEAQTYSKSWKHHIKGVTPVFLQNGNGSLVRDVDGNEYVDLIQGLLPNILGYSNEEVNNAVYETSKDGHSFSLAHPIEIELAEKLCEIIPCAEMVRFGKNGSDATAGAVRVARAFTGKDHVAVCGYHGWQDWFIGSTTRKAGVPKSAQELVHPFEYNNLEHLRSLLESRAGDFAAVIMEPVNFNWPDKDYLKKVKDLVHSHGALLIFDEICSGFHFGIGGAQKIFNVKPDLATFGKALGNGWPISCVVGRREIMQVFDDAFVSFTFAGDVACMAGALKVIEILERDSTYSKMESAGITIRDGSLVMAKAMGLDKFFSLKGHPHWSVFNFINDEGNIDSALRSLWIQEVTRRGVLLLTTFNISASLTESDISIVLNAFAYGFKRVAEAKRLGINPEVWLDGPIPVPAFSARNIKLDKNKCSP